MSGHDIVLCPDGHPNQPEYAFCVRCGRPIVTTLTVAEPAASTVSEQPTGPGPAVEPRQPVPARSRGPQKAVVAIAVVIAVLGAVGTVAGLALSHRGADSDRTAPRSMTPPASPKTVVAAASAPVVSVCQQPPTAKPLDIVLTCADAGSEVISIRWTTWGPGTADGSGEAVTNDCNPDCADGHDQFTSAQVHLSKPVASPSGDQFSEMTITTPGSATPVSVQPISLYTGPATHRPSTSQPNGATALGYGSIKLGMSLDKLMVSDLIQPNQWSQISSAETQGGCAFLNMTNGGRVFYNSKTSQVEGIDFGPTMTTSTGIRIGDPLSKVSSAYPNLNTYDESVSLNSTTQYLFNFNPESSPHLMQIVLALKRQTCFN